MSAFGWIRHWIGRHWHYWYWQLRRWRQTLLFDIEPPLNIDTPSAAIIFIDSHFQLILRLSLAIGWHYATLLLHPLRCHWLRHCRHSLIRRWLLIRRQPGYFGFRAFSWLFASFQLLSAAFRPYFAGCRRHCRYVIISRWCWYELFIAIHYCIFWHR